jgi:glycosyltransferase involved in cell wall biosynthesis
MTAISICVATLGDRPTLARLLDSFDAVERPAPCELILVFNTPAPPDATWVRQTPGYHLRLLHEPAKGKSRALNRALDAAQGELLVFTDDDVQFDRRWLAELWAGAQRYPTLPIFGGTIEPSGEIPQWIRRSVNLHGILLSAHTLPGGEGHYIDTHYPFGPNMAVRRAALVSAAARWPEHLGPGTAVPVGDEAEFLAQISTPGTPNRMFLPAAVVHHEVDPSYFTLRAAVRRTFYAGLAQGRLGAAHRWMVFSKPAGLVPRTVERLGRIRSFQEFACNASRVLGFLIGRYVSRGRGLTTPGIA